MNPRRRSHRLSTLLVSVGAAWLAWAAMPPAPVADPLLDPLPDLLPDRAVTSPAADSGSLYPAPRIDPSAPVAEPSPTF